MARGLHSERCKVGVDARITTGGTAYQLQPDMAGETVVLLWGLFNDEMYAEFDAEKFGPHFPVCGPVPLHRYPGFERGKADERADCIRALADQLDLPISALAGSDMQLSPPPAALSLRHQTFDANAHAYHFAGAMAKDLARPLAKLALEDRVFVDRMLSETLIRSIVLARVRDCLRNKKPGEHRH
ncbi:hypothetical protein GCM10022212_07860 [Actimicrobium antarcticum]|uniref:Uncharacterized protein n=1 Tax=Actimicrobium antarcticum TaxID=1051899 RepID=A0ABP7SS02_9BURK